MDERRQISLRVPHWPQPPALAYHPRGLSLALGILAPTAAQRAAMSATTIEHADGTKIVTDGTVVTQAAGGGEARAVAAPSWLPLESNPEVLNPFVRRMGLPDGWGFADVFGLDEELLMMVPQPCVALCLLYPSTKISAPRREDLRKREQPASHPEGIFFVQQHDEIGNACGTIAAVHALSNCAAAGAFELNPGPLATFVESVKDKSVGDKGWALANAVELQELSDETAAAGETEGAGTDDANDSHFISFVNLKGSLYELDGRTWDADGNAFPVFHGPTSVETFVSDAAKVIREDFMARDPENYGFNVTALCKLE